MIPTACTICGSPDVIAHAPGDAPSRLPVLGGVPISYGSLPVAYCLQHWPSGFKTTESEDAMTKESPPAAGHNAGGKPDLARFRDRLVNLEQEARDIASSRADLKVEMKSAGLSKTDIAGIKLAVRRHFESPEAREDRQSAEAVAEALGVLVGTPLADAVMAGAGR